MTLKCEMLSLVIRRDSIEKKYKGGYQAFLRDIPNRTHQTDGAIDRVGFMSPIDVKAAVFVFESRGLKHLAVDGKTAVDMVVVDGFFGVQGQCDWLTEDIEGLDIPQDTLEPHVTFIGTLAQ